MSLDFGVEGTSVPVAGELLSNPAAYVLSDHRHDAPAPGFVVATGYYDGRPTRRLVDRAAVGGDLRSHLGDLAVERHARSARRSACLSSAERIAGGSAVTRRDALAMSALSRRNLRPRWPRPPIADPNPFVTETLLLHGGLLEHIELRGRDANLVRVQWISCRDLLAARDWTDLGRYFLPLTDAPDVYPAWSPDAGEKVAGQRLEKGAPLRQPPWDREDGGDPASTAAVGPGERDAVARSPLSRHGVQGRRRSDARVPQGRGDADRSAGAGAGHRAAGTRAGRLHGSAGDGRDRVAVRPALRRVGRSAGRARAGPCGARHRRSRRHLRLRRRSGLRHAVGAVGASAAHRARTRRSPAGRAGRPPGRVEGSARVCAVLDRFASSPA